MFYQIIFHGFEDEYTCYIHEGTNIESVYTEAYKQYAILVQQFEDACKEDEYTPCKSLTEFCLKQPTYIPTDYISYIHIAYRAINTNIDYNLTKED